MKNTAVTVPEGPTTEAFQGAYYPMTVQECIAAWLESKTERSKSAKTARAYRDTIGQFRAALTSAGYDLQSDPRTVALAAQGYAARSVTGAPVSASTFNQRLAILSSFYTYAIKQGVCEQNPLDLVERRPKQVTHAALPQDPASIKNSLASIDRDTPEGKRDYTLLVLALATGRRASELAALRWRHLQVNGSHVRVTWERCKGGKMMFDKLSTHTSTALLSYLQSIYGSNLASLPGARPCRQLALVSSWRLCLHNHFARQRPVLIHTCPFSANDGKQTAILSLSCSGNWSPEVTPTRLGRCRSNWFVCFQKDGSILKLLICLRALLYLRDKRWSFFFVDRKNSVVKSKRTYSCFSSSTSKWIWPLIWPSRLRRWCANAAENSSMFGSARWIRAESPNGSPLLQGSRKTKRR